MLPRAIVSELFGKAVVDDENLKWTESMLFNVVFTTFFWVWIFFPLKETLEVMNRTRIITTLNL